MDDNGYIRFRSRRVTGDEDMDMTPMVDVTFLLLIFFMITAAFSLQRSFNLPSPSSDQASTNSTVEDFEEDPDYIVVRVDQYNTFHVGAASWDEEREAPNEFDLLITMRKAREADANRESRRMLILADGRANYEYVIKAIDAGNELGIEELKLVTVAE